MRCRSGASFYQYQVLEQQKSEIEETLNQHYYQTSLADIHNLTSLYEHQQTLIKLYKSFDTQLDGLRQLINDAQSKLLKPKPINTFDINPFNINRRATDQNEEPWSIDIYIIRSFSISRPDAEFPDPFGLTLSNMDRKIKEPYEVHFTNGGDYIDLDLGIWLDAQEIPPGYHVAISLWASLYPSEPDKKEMTITMEDLEYCVKAVIDELYPYYSDMSQDMSRKGYTIPYPDFDGPFRKQLEDFLDSVKGTPS